MYIFATTQLVGGLVHPKRAKLTLLALLVTASKTHVLVGVSHQVGSRSDYQVSPTISAATENLWPYLARKSTNIF